MVEEVPKGVGVEDVTEGSKVEEARFREAEVQLRFGATGDPKEGVGSAL